MTGPGSSPLYRSYRAADDAYHKHMSTCPTCTPTGHCGVGVRLFEMFAHRQDAYLKHLRDQRG